MAPGSESLPCTRYRVLEEFDAQVGPVVRVPEFGASGGAAQHIQAYVRHYNEVRLHSAIGYVTPADHLAGLTKKIHAERDRKLEEARMRRRAASREIELANAS